jgi:hypothetical protein
MQCPICNVVSLCVGVGLGVGVGVFVCGCTCVAIARLILWNLTLWLVIRHFLVCISSRFMRLCVCVSLRRSFYSLGI